MSKKAWVSLADDADLLSVSVGVHLYSVTEFL